MNVNDLSAEELRELLAKKEKQGKLDQAKREKEFNAEKSAFVTESVKLMQELSEMMREFKHDAIKKGNKLHADMYKVFNKKEKELKQFALVSEDGMYKLVIERQDRQQLDETAEVHIETIKTILREKFQSRNKKMYAMLEGVLLKNNKGDYDEKLVSKLRKNEHIVDDPKFSEALAMLAKSYYVTDTATYFRGYKFNKESNKWEDVPMQFSGM